MPNSTMYRTFRADELDRTEERMLEALAPHGGAIAVIAVIAEYREAFLPAARVALVALDAAEHSHAKCVDLSYARPRLLGADACRKVEQLRAVAEQLYSVVGASRSTAHRELSTYVDGLAERARVCQRAGLEAVQ